MMVISCRISYWSINKDTSSNTNPANCYYFLIFNVNIIVIASYCESNINGKIEEDNGNSCKIKTKLIITNIQLTW
jgi:hypothetical protein